MKHNFFNGKFSAKGYYIALILCAAAIGICGYLYYRSANEDAGQLQADPTDVSVVTPGGDDLTVGGPDGVQPQTPQEDTPADATGGDHGSLQTCAPLNGQTVAEYAMDCLSYNETTRDWRTHDGIDIAAEAGSMVVAAADGTVYTVCSDETMGTTVVIRHEGGYVSVYSSLAEDVAVAAGDTVSMGDVIGAVGNTALLESAIGDHLHFSVTCDGEPIDPAEFINMG